MFDWMSDSFIPLTLELHPFIADSFWISHDLSFLKVQEYLKDWAKL